MEHVSVISNPPYNVKWQHPATGRLEPRFNACELPPESNANYAFILTALEEATDRAVMILPNGILTTTNQAEAEIRKYLVDSNFVEAVIACADNMFEATSIPVCVLVLNKRKVTDKIEFIDLRHSAIEEKREQRGQFGGNSHTKRTYIKRVNVYTEETIDDVIAMIEEERTEKGLCKSATLEEVIEEDYILAPARYVGFKLDEEHRTYSEIINDLNRVIEQRNACKLTINETIAKETGLFDIYESAKASQENTDELNKLDFIEPKIRKTDYIKTSKNKNEIKFENNSKEFLSPIFLMIFNQWRTLTYLFNEEENRYLAELRDALLPDLMNGNIDLSEVE